MSQSMLLSELFRQRAQQGLPAIEGFPMELQQGASAPHAMQPPAMPTAPQTYNALTNNQPAHGDVNQGYRPPGRIGAFWGIKRA